MTSVIEGSFVRMKSMADGSLQLVVEVEPRNAVAAFTLFSAPGTPMALAALQCAKAAPAALEAAPQAAKGGERARWVGMRCQEPAFQRWLQGAFPAQWEAAHGTTPALWAASTVRAVCSIDSRAELDSDATAAARFDLLIRKPFGASNEK